MKRTTEPKDNSSLITRNMNKGNNKYKITESDEIGIKDAIQIPNETTIQENKAGTVINWYGNRLNILKDFYCKTNRELSIAVGYSDSFVARWIKNQEKPPDKIVDKFCFLFEVPKEFFTNEEITIKITKQIKLTMI